MYLSNFYNKPFHLEAEFATNKLFVNFVFNWSQHFIF